MSENITASEAIEIRSLYCDEAFTEEDWKDIRELEESHYNKQGYTNYLNRGKILKIFPNLDHLKKVKTECQEKDQISKQSKPS